MKFKNKILLDRLLGQPLAFLMNGIVWPAGKILRRNHDDSIGYVRLIAILKIVGMGSIVRATPLVNSLKARYPHAKIIFITSESNRILLERLELFDTVIYLEDSSVSALFFSLCKAIFRLWKQRVDLFFDLEVYSAFSTIVGTVSLARNRYGFYRSSVSFRSRLYTHLVYFNDRRSINQVYLKLGSACGATMADDHLVAPRISEDDTVGLGNYFSAQGRSEGEMYLVVNPNASDLMLERRWPLDYFAEAINSIGAITGLPIYLVGSPGERNYNEALMGLLDLKKAKVYNTAGEITFGQVLVLIRHARCILTNDSGLFHIALSLNTPVVSLWGPGCTAHYSNYPYSTNIALSNSEIYCSPCLYRVDFPPCRGDNVCMKSIKPDTVISALCKLLGINQIQTDTENKFVTSSNSKTGILIRGE
jgi:ADP-heptose:LPS heptosyltransferase